ncbi:MAG: leucine-rich repeat protein [Candidatus Cloacimonetes bacterium]|nr:leucine-rich repeat protein [Candidatus Cloacimonadota bacterium]
MKKIFIGLFSLLLGITLLSGCSFENSGGGGGETQHTHSYSTVVVAATCTSEGYTVHKCSCGDSYIDSKTSALGHNWVEGERNYSCSRCGRVETEGFTFKLATMDGESCYAVTNATSKAVVNGVLEIPRKYESLPVRGIMNWSFSAVTEQVKKIIIHDNIKNIYSNLWHGTSIWTPDWDTMSALAEIVFDSTCSGMRIEAGAFNNCPNLARANIKKGMISYVPCDAVTTQNGGSAEYIFKGTPYLTNNLTKKNGLNYLADLLLYADLNEISSNITIDSDTVWINPCVFNKCTFIKSVAIPKTVKSIGKEAFNGCSQLEIITFNGTMAEFKKIAIAPSVFSGTKATSVTCADGSVTSYTYKGYTYHIGGY